MFLDGIVVEYTHLTVNYHIIYGTFTLFYCIVFISPLFIQVCLIDFEHLLYKSDITDVFNCLNTIDTCLDQSKATWSFCYYTLNTCNHSLNKSAALHFSCNCATHLLLSATHLLLHTTHYFKHKTYHFQWYTKMISQYIIGKTHLFKILNTLCNWKYLIHAS